jgi:hypothetical protein
MIKGASGASYRFRVHALEAEFGAEGAVYVVTKSRPLAEGRSAHTRIFAGQTGDLSASVAEQRRSPSVLGLGPNCVCVHPEAVESKRLAIESDLLSVFRPPCNRSA